MQPPKIYGTGEKVILSVEDDRASYQLLEAGFSQVDGDYRLYRVENGAEALAFLRRSGPYEHVPTPSLVLLNLNMPGLTGFEVLEAIKDDPAIGDVPSVVFSSSSLNSDKARCLAMGARAFVTKPSDLDEFLNVLRHICNLA